MIINNVPGSSINPVEEKKSDIKLEDIEQFLISVLSKIDPKNYYLYDSHKVKNNRALLKDLIDNLKSRLTELNLEYPETLDIINNIFSTINNQLILLNQMPVKKIENNDVLVILVALLISNLKKILS